MNTIFIGYDEREHEAAQVAAYSLRRRTPVDTTIYMLNHRVLRDVNLFLRAWRVSPLGQYVDEGDGKPFSTQFSHSRFLVFHLARALTCTGPCMFVDCDWLFRADVSKVMETQRRAPDRIGVVSRKRAVDAGSIKMDGMVQSAYPRKLWSAMFTFMPRQNWADHFTPGDINTKPGRDLHAFLGLPNEAFWEIPAGWHYIPSLDTPVCVTADEPQGVHFSEFSPWLNWDRFADAPELFRAWIQERDAMRESIAKFGVNFYQDLRKAMHSAQIMG